MPSMNRGKWNTSCPTANQKHIVEDVPFTEWENPYIDTVSGKRAENRACLPSGRPLYQYSGSQRGYDYTIYDMDYRELDGGVYDNPDITIRQALDEIVTDLKEPAHRSSLEAVSALTMN